MTTQEQAAKKSSDKVAFAKIVRRQKPSYWARRLKTIPNPQLRGWVASLIWWAYVNLPEKGELVESMDDYNPHHPNPIADLPPTLKRLGLPTPPIINLPMTTAPKRNADQRGWLRKSFRSRQENVSA